MARSAETNKRMRDERRREILSAALGVFSARGLAATKIGDIAAAAGISHGLLYHYFPSKEAIYLELVRGALGRMNAAVRELERLPLPPREKVRLALEQLVRGLEAEDTAQTHLLIAQASASRSTPRGVRAVIQRKRGVPYAAMARILAAGQRDGTVRKRDPEDQAVLFWVLVRGLAVQRAAWGDDFRAPALSILTSIFLEEE